MTANTVKHSNPILQSEFRYQRFVIERSRNSGFWIFLAILLVAPSLLISIGYAAGLLLNLFPVLEWHLIPGTWHLNLLLTLIVANISMYIVVTLVNMALAARSISREKEKHTWSLLRLTHISSNQIVFGKWWASLRALNGDLAMVLILRIGLLAIALAIFIPSLHAGDGISADYRLYFLMLTPLLIIHGILDAALSVILGIAGAIPDDAWQTVGGFTTMMIRLVIGIAVAWWFWTILVQVQTDFSAALLTTISGIVVTAALILLSLLAAQILVARS